MSHKSFKNWIFSFKRPFNTAAAMILALSSLLMAVFTIINKLEVFKINWSADKLMEINIIAHIALLLILILFPNLKKFTKLNFNKDIREDIYSTLELEKDSKEQVLTRENKIVEVEKVYRRANTAINQFLNSFKGALWSYLLLYTLMGLKTFSEDLSIPGWVYDILQILSNNLATIFLIFCFTIISIPAKNPFKSHIHNRDVFFVILVALTLVELFIRLSGDESLANLPFYMLSGIASSVAIAQITGRLDSKLIDADYWIYLLLYLYAGIQPFFTFFVTSRDETINLVIMLYLALFLKTIFFLFVYWCINYNKLFYYLVRVNRIQSIVDKDWKTIQEKIHDEEGEVII